MYSECNYGIRSNGFILMADRFLLHWTEAAINTEGKSWFHLVPAGSLHHGGPAHSRAETEAGAARGPSEIYGPAGSPTPHAKQPFPVSAQPEPIVGESQRQGWEHSHTTDWPVSAPPTSGAFQRPNKSPQILAIRWNMTRLALHSCRAVQQINHLQAAFIKTQVQVSG